MKSLVKKVIMTGFLIILLTQPTLSENSPSCLRQCSRMKYFSCEICYKTCQITVQQEEEQNSKSTVVETLSFQSCREEFCARYQTYTYTSGNQTSQQTMCAQYDWMNHTENQCTQECCNYPSFSRFNSDTFNQCVATNEKLHQDGVKTGVIAGIAIGAIFAFVVCLCCFKVIKEFICKCFNSPFSSSSGHPLNLVYIQNQQMNLSNVSLKQIPQSTQKIDFSKLTWSQRQKQMNSSNRSESTQYCSICLDVNMNCQTSCGHKFHLICFKDWIRKNADCPLCKSREFNEMRVWCEMCREKQGRLKLGGSSLLVGMDGGRMCCNECRERGSARQEDEVKEDKIGGVEVMGKEIMIMEEEA